MSGSGNTPIVCDALPICAKLILLLSIVSIWGETLTCCSNYPPPSSVAVSWPADAGVRKLVSKEWRNARVCERNYAIVTETSQGCDAGLIESRPCACPQAIQKTIGVRQTC